MRTVPGFCASFSNFPPSPLDQTISVNHPQSPQLISFVCVQKNSPEVDGSNELKSIGCNRKRHPSRYSPTRILTQHASRTFKRGEKCSLWPAESLRNGPHWTLHEVWPEAGTKPGCLADADPSPLRLGAGLSGGLRCSFAWNTSCLT